MKNSNPIQTQTVVIPPGVPNNPGVKLVQLGGELFGCVVASQPFRMKFDSAGEFDCIQGAIIPVPGAFKSMTFLNYTASVVLLQIFVGVEGITIIPTNTIKVYPTYPKGTDLKGGTALAAGAVAAFNGLDGLNLRKQIAVQNRDAGGNTIEVWDGNNVAVAEIDANSAPWTMESGGLFTVKNPAGAAVSRVIITEIFYTS